MMGTLSFNQITIHNRWPCKYLMRESYGENDSVLRNTHIHMDTHTVCTHKEPQAQTAEPQRADIPYCRARKKKSVIECIYLIFMHYLNGSFV